MTVPNKSSHPDDNAFTTGTQTLSTEAGEPSRAASVAFIRNWPLSILCLCFFPLLIGLGSWQLQRGEEKQQILDKVDARLSSQPQKISELIKPKVYTPVRLLGFYTDEYFYLDNRTRNGRVGYEILQVFETGNSKSGKARWLINRGWLPASSDRNRLPDIAYPLAAKVITGFLYPNGDTAVDEQTAVSSHSRIQSLQPLSSGQLRLQQPAWHIRLSADSDTALLTDWQLITTNPQKHRGYAVQWFTMAAALLVLWLLAATNMRRIVREKWFKKSPEQT
ncbi:SURF1 family protein [uncultured Microbulbifer sp.]|uniref:SURF1 family protein n=1 Tax=uncultured Microbulbifer sp. TaxID=348147 RepID=UPI002631476A|nr:SURF1 family cytochrome oxidase biogenesis protein [uncultured Microbulbifer sp.]